MSETSLAVLRDGTGNVTQDDGLYSPANATPKNANDYGAVHVDSDKQERERLLSEETPQSPTEGGGEGEVIDQQDEGKPTYYRALFVTVSVFMGYSGMVVLQDKVKTQMGIKSKTDEAYVFGVGVSFLYLGNLIFRLLHNIIFSFMKPRQRVMLSYVSMFIAQLMLVIPYFICDVKHVVFVFLAYIIAGVGIGTFESNLMSCITPLGHATKSWAVLGLPLGFNIISIGSFGLFAIWPDSIGLQAGVYFFIAFMNLVGLVVYAFFIPNVEFEATNSTIRTFIEDLKKYKEWLPQIWKNCVALCLDMFAVSIFAAIALYIFNVEEIPLWPASTTQVPKNAFQSVYYVFSFCGDFFSRRIAYRDKLRNPLYFWVFTIVGAAMVVSKTALIAPLGMFCVMFANGSIYAQTTKSVDLNVPKAYNLMALSVWLFVGDIGSFVGAQLTQYLVTGIGTVWLPDTPDIFNHTNSTDNMTAPWTQLL